MGGVGSKSAGGNLFNGINMEVEVEDEVEEQVEEQRDSGRDYPLEITVGGFRVIHDHDSDDNPIYYIYDENNQLYREVHSTSELTEAIEELKNDR